MLGARTETISRTPQHSNPFLSPAAGDAGVQVTERDCLLPLQCQGMTLDLAKVSLRGMFAEGQVRRLSNLCRPAKRGLGRLVCENG